MEASTDETYEILGVVRSLNTANTDVVAMDRYIRCDQRRSLWHIGGEPVPSKAQPS